MNSLRIAFAHGKILSRDLRNAKVICHYWDRHRFYDNYPRLNTLFEVDVTLLYTLVQYYNVRISREHSNILIPNRCHRHLELHHLLVFFEMSREKQGNPEVSTICLNSACRRILLRWHVTLLRVFGLYNETLFFFFLVPAEIKSSHLGEVLMRFHITNNHC
jgi:hypothetical protein